MDVLKPAKGRPIRVALMCENPRVYRSLGSRLNADPGFTVVGTFDCLIEKVLDVMETQPDVAILGISHITPFNMLVCEAVRQASDGVRIVILPSFTDDPAEFEMAYDAGASAVILKDINTPALVEQIRALTNDRSLPE